MKVSIEQGKLYELRDVAAALGISYPAVWDRINRCRTLPEPQTRFGKRYFYSQSEYDRIMNFVQTTKEDK